tara:strand:- start:1214 stop:2983 length:1770 start_codon:yes stop_codon:yes gene_type:complete
MLAFIKRNIFLIVIFIFTLTVGFVTFLTFIEKSFIKLNEFNLQILLIVDLALLILFFLLIFLDIKKSLKQDISVKGSLANRKYITFFSLFTLIPSILISVFSLFLFSFALEKYFDKKITVAVNNSYEIAKSYVEDVRNKIEADILLVSLDLNKSVNIFYENPKRFMNIMNTQKLVREIDEIYLIDSNGNLIISSSLDSKYSPPDQRALEMVFNQDKPLKIINTPKNSSAAIIKLNQYVDTYLYVVKFLDQKISNYLKESEEALDFYYVVESQSSGIKYSFALIYIVVVALLLFLSITIAIRFSSRFFLSINNLISASDDIGKGKLDVKVPEIKTDKELEILIKNFNLMIDRLKTQQDKLLLTERHEAWENVARKLAHEIKNPLTPIQLTIDQLKSKYIEKLPENEKSKYDEYLKTIYKQIKQIENLVNEFSDFARMPKPILKKNNLYDLINSNISILKNINSNIVIKVIGKNEIFINCDSEQINRVFFNLIKNSIESINEKSQKSDDFKGIINIELFKNNDYIKVIIIDNGIGFPDKNIEDITKPYFTTKKNGTGLGLPIVNKIINDHNGKMSFLKNKDGAKIEINLPI